MAFALSPIPSLPTSHAGSLLGPFCLAGPIALSGGLYVSREFLFDSMSTAHTQGRPMKHPIRSLFVLLGALVVVAGGMQDAEARRLGGGKSFGSKPAYNSPYKRSVSPTGQTASQRAAQAQNTQRKAELAGRGGLMGMLGGLALGGLLGALFFGGAFENLNFLDIAVFGLIAFLLYRLFAARARPAMARSGQTGGPDTSVGGAGFGGSVGRDADPGEEVRQSWGLDTEEMRRKFSPGGQGTDLLPVAAPDAEPDAEFVEDFDEQAFLQGAQRAYRMLQEAWDRGDLELIRALCADTVFNEIQSQLGERQGDNRTDVLTLNAELLEVRRVGQYMAAAVLFDAYLREADGPSSAVDRGQQVREVWHFTRPVDADGPTWLLDGIQQLAD